ncbi:MAG: hypothetical protein V7607_6185 [Solirubrobacteraceae bacterium]
MKRRFPVALDPAGVARAILSIAYGEEHLRQRCWP